MQNYLEPKDQKLFFKIHKNLLLFVNQKIKSSANFNDLSDWGNYKDFVDDIIFLRNHLFKNKDLIDQFIAANPANFNDEELAITKNWKSAIIGDFILFKHLKNCSIFLGGEGKKAYGVIGLMGNIDEVLPKDRLPSPVSTAIMPFSGRIIYDGLFEAWNAVLGNGYIRSFTDDYNRIKKGSGIIMTLE